MPKLIIKYDSIPIDHNIPMPKLSYKGEQGLPHKFRKMKVGDSWPMPRDATKTDLQNVLGAARKAGMKAASRWIPGEECYRIWRVE